MKELKLEIKLIAHFLVNYSTVQFVIILHFGRFLGRWLTWSEDQNIFYVVEISL